MLEPTRGPPLRVVSTYPEDGAGFDCATDDLGCGVPIDTPVEIRFDRFLLPSTAVRQSFALYSGDPTNTAPPADRGPALTPRYDVVERVVTYELPPGVLLMPNTHYTVELVAPVYDDDFGFRAFDGEPLDADTTTRLSFLTSNQSENLGPLPASPTCARALDTLGDGCVGGSCHGSTGRVMGLDLSTADGLSRTAIGRVAHQAETGPNTGHPTENPARFGVAMPLIDPGRPDNSYLMYKLLAAPENYRLSEAEPDLCGTSHRAPVDPVTCVPASADEVDRLRAWFLRGVAMPRGTAGAAPWLDRDGLRVIDGFIAAGAVCP